LITRRENGLCDATKTRRDRPEIFPRQKFLKGPRNNKSFPVFIAHIAGTNGASHEVKRRRLRRGSRTTANPESPKPGRFEQPDIRPRMRFGDCNLRTVTRSFPRGRVSGFQVKTNFKVPRSYSGLPFTRDAYDSSKLSPSRSLPRFEDDPFTAGHVARCVAKLHRLYVAQCAALPVTPIHLTVFPPGSSLLVASAIRGSEERGLTKSAHPLREDTLILISAFESSRRPWHLGSSAACSPRIDIFTRLRTWTRAREIAEKRRAQLHVPSISRPRI